MSERAKFWELVTAILDEIIPPQDPWPGAGRELLLNKAVIVSSQLDGDKAAVEDLIDKIGHSFHDLSAEEKRAVLRRHEQESPEAFAALVRHTYNVYYSREPVLKVLEAETGYPARPPLYFGYQMPEFDPEVLATQRKRKPLWRKV